MIHLLLVLVSFFFMEFIAWFSHKYVMHGFLWSVHKDHHIRLKPKDSFFEKNDLFIVIYAFPAMILIMLGFASGNYYLVSIGAGFTIYGITYFLIHDVLIHHRFPHNLTITGGYLAALIRAHQAHHAPRHISDFESFGLLVFPRRYLNKK
jgi:beta-carotene 3-hydroxylase